MTGAQAWVEQPLTRRHDRETFDCGVDPLNDYLRRYARQNHESGGAKTFVAVPSATSPTILSVTDSQYRLTNEGAPFTPA